MSAQHVLIVEDSLVYRRLLSRMLTQWGYIVSEAENGVAALAILENQSVSLVISDWEMPEMNGLTLCREIRRRPFLSVINISEPTRLQLKADSVERM